MMMMTMTTIHHQRHSKTIKVMMGPPWRIFINSTKKNNMAHGVLAKAVGVVPSFALPLQAAVWTSEIWAGQTTGDLSWIFLTPGRSSSSSIKLNAQRKEPRIEVWRRLEMELWLNEFRERFSCKMCKKFTFRAEAWHAQAVVITRHCFAPRRTIANSMVLLDSQPWIHIN